MIATVGSDGFQLWNATTAELTKTVIDKKEEVHCIAFSPDSRTVATWDYDGRMQWWDVDTGKNIRTITGHTSVWQSIEYSPNGTTM